MEQHKKNLENLCRVCAKKGKKYTFNKNSDACKALLLAAFGVDVDSEAEEVYPTYVCSNCYKSMKRIKQSKESGVILKSHLSISTWLPHTESCLICNYESSRGGRPPKRKLSGHGTGRPRDDDISHLSREIMRAVNNINPPQYSNIPLQASHFFPTPTLPSLLCQHCRSIPNRPIELLPCHHLICISCIMKITETRILTCMCSPAEITVTTPHPVVLQLLSSLLLNCPQLCGQVIELKGLLQHLESNCSTTDIPPLSQVTVQQLVDSPPGSAVEQHSMGLLVEKFIPPSGSVTYKSAVGKV